MTTTLVRSGADAVHAATGEVVGVVEEFSMTDYVSKISTPTAFEHQKKLAAAYDAACNSLIGENDVQKEGGRTFKKKSAWRKLARHFSISTAIARVEKEMLGDFFCATVTVRASAPWGQTSEAVGACSTDEATGRRTITIADAIATAETRATNRSVSNLIAMGEVSAEEMSKGSNGQSRSSSDKPASEKVMPFGKTKGKKLGDLSDSELEGALEWCRKTDAAKFKDLIDSLNEVLEARSTGAASGHESVEPEDEIPF